MPRHKSQPSRQNSSRRAREYEDDDDDEEQYDRRPPRRQVSESSVRSASQAETPEQGTVMARCMLLTINSATLVFGLLLVISGASALIRLDTTDPVTGIERQFIAVIVFGGVIVVGSVFAICGACCAISRDSGFQGNCCSNRLLMAYYVGILLMCAGLLYLAMLCFMFIQKAGEYLETYWDAIESLLDNQGLQVEEVEGQLKQHSMAAGFLCLGTIVLNLVCAHLSAKVMGYRWTARRTIMVTNIVGFILGVVLVIIAFLPATKKVGVKNTSLPKLTGAVGVFVVFMSLIGFGGAYFRKTGLLFINFVVVGLLSLVLLIAAIVALTEAKKNPENGGGWMFIKANFINLCPECELVQDESSECCSQKARLAIWNNLTLLGVSACVTLVCLTVNAGASCYLWRFYRRHHMEALSSEEMDSLSGRRPGRRRELYGDDQL